MTADQVPAARPRAAAPAGAAPERPGDPACLLRRGSGDFGRFGRYADSMLEEREFFIRKAIGWVLRDTGRKRPELIAAWLEPRAERASGVTLREAVKPLPPQTAARLLAAGRVRSGKPGGPAGPGP